MSPSSHQPTRHLLVRCPVKGSAAVEPQGRVLVIDEHPRRAETLARLVANDAHTVRLGSTSPAARGALVRDSSWATAVLCDLSDPTPEKVAATAQLRRLRPDLSWIISTSTPDHPAVKTMVKHGHVMVLKPFTSRELRAALRRTICRKSGFEMPAVRPTHELRQVG